MDEHLSYISPAYAPLPSSLAVLLCIYGYSCLSTALSPHTLWLEFWLHCGEHESPTSITLIFCNRIVYQSLFLVCPQSSASPTSALKNVLHFQRVFYPLVCIPVQSLLAKSVCQQGDVVFSSCEHLLPGWK